MIDQRIKVDEKSYWIRLNSDKPMNPFSWKPPITWEGTINGQRVKLIQLGQSASTQDDFEFQIYPILLQPIKSDVIHVINRALRALD